MRIRSAAAIIGPERYWAVPNNPGQAWSPKMASTLGLFITPSSTIYGAPPFSPSGAPSSAGWKINLTVPGKSSRMLAKISAAPMSPDI